LILPVAARPHQPRWHALAGYQTWGLLLGAWPRRHQLRLADAVYVELAAALDVPLVTADPRLHPVPGADVVVV
jgi:predicted nucleic acid-binding protein